MFDKKQLDQYTKVFGLAKMQFLFSEFKTKHETGFANISPDNSKEEQRIFFHNLRSASLVFGMVKLSKLCEHIEENILNGKELLVKDIKETKALYDQSVKEVEKHLN